MDSKTTSKFINSVMVVGMGGLIKKASMLIAFIVLVRCLPKDEVGSFVIILLISDFFATLNALVLDGPAIAKIISSSSAELKSTISKVAIFYKCIFSVVTLPIIYILFPLMAEILNLDILNVSIAYVLIFFMTINIEGAISRVLQGFHEYKKISIINSLNGIFKLIFVVLFVWFLKYGFVGLVYSYILANIVSVLLLLRFVPFSGYFNTDWRQFRELFCFGFPLGLNRCLTFVFTRIDTAMIGAMIDPVAVAVYVAASKIPESIREVYSSYHYVFFPNMSSLYAQKRYREVEQLLNNSLRIISFVVSFVGYIVFVFQVEIITLLFSEEYIEGAPVLAILTFALCVALASNIIGTSLVAFGQSDKPVKINLMDTFANIAGNLILIPMFGLQGAAFATLISRSMTNPVNVLFFRHTGIKLDVSQYLKPVFVLAIGVCFYLLVQPDSIFIKVALVASFIVVCCMFSIIRKQDLAQVFASFRDESDSARA